MSSGEKTSSPGATQAASARKRWLTGATILGVLAGYLLLDPFGRGCSTSSSRSSSVTVGDLTVELMATPGELVEGLVKTVQLDAAYHWQGQLVQPDTYQFSQAAGPAAPLTTLGPTKATADVSAVDVTADTDLVFQLVATYQGVQATVQVTVRVHALSDLPQPPLAEAEPLISSLTAEPAEFVEGTVDTVVLTATFREPLTGSHAWRCKGGPGLAVKDLGRDRAEVDVRGLNVASDAELVFELSVSLIPGSPPQSATVAVVIRAADAVPALGPNVQIGGQSKVAARFQQGEQEWALFNVANRITATPVGVTRGPTHSLYLPGFVRDLDLIEPTTAEVTSQRWALVAMGSEGIGVVDVADPTSMSLTRTVRVGYELTGVTFVDGGGTVTTDASFASTRGTVTALVTDGVTLWIADEDYGLHRAPLANLLGGAGPVVETDGTLVVELERSTLQYAGEHGWGGPKDLELHEGRLIAALGQLGLGIFDPVSLEQVGGYNLYTDVPVREDWFLDMDVATQVQEDPVSHDKFLDDFTGMPDWRQVEFEIKQVWHGDVTAPTPWADFERYAKYYYEAKAVDIADHPGRSIAYVAYGLAGLVAVDVTGYQTATPGEGFRRGSYLGYVPALPVHGPEKEILRPSQSLFPMFGVGRLREGGAVGVVVAGDLVYFTDHFAGLVVVSGAVDPATAWRQAGAPFDNDTTPPLGNHLPSDEFVTSYDMRPADPTDHESLPVFLGQPPVLVATGEVHGHGSSLLLLPGQDTQAAGAVDVIYCEGAGGLTFLDLALGQAPGARFTAPVYFPTTDEVGALPDGSPGQAVNVGHSDGVTASSGYLYLADGPHGVSAWKLLGADGLPTSQLHLVANALQAEGAVTIGDDTILPTPHAFDMELDLARGLGYVLCRTSGLRRVRIDRVEGGEGRAGSPLLLAPRPGDVFEHKAEHAEEEEEEGGGQAPALPGQDHATGVLVVGDLAFVADGRNGLTIYDLTRDPTNPASGFIVSNLGGGTGASPLLGLGEAIVGWADPVSRRGYVFLACGPRGLGVVDVTSPAAPVLVKVFQPIKVEDEGEEGEVHVGTADGRAVDVLIQGEHLFLSHDSFGVLCYALTDLVAPLPPGVLPTELFKPGSAITDHRPVALGHFRLAALPEYAELGGGALKMTMGVAGGRRTLWVGYGAAGAVAVEWTDPRAPAFKTLLTTVGEATGVALANGWVFVADGGGGLALFR